VYILGSGGAILGNWRDVTSFQADPCSISMRTAFQQRKCRRRCSSIGKGISAESMEQTMALPPRDPFGFQPQPGGSSADRRASDRALEDSVRVWGFWRRPPALWKRRIDGGFGWLTVSAGASWETPR